MIYLPKYLSITNKVYKCGVTSLTQTDWYRSYYDESLMPVPIKLVEVSSGKVMTCQAWCVSAKEEPEDCTNDEYFSNQEPRELAIPASAEQGRFDAPILGRGGIWEERENDDEDPGDVERRTAQQHGDGIKYQCQHCEMGIANEEQLPSHRIFSTEEKPCECMKCNQRFKLKGQLAFHSRKHLREKLYECSTCGKTFTRKNNVAKDSMIHGGYGPYYCEICERKFSRLRMLVKHSRCHREGLPFRCDECKYGFCQKLPLINHLRTHTGEKPFQCVVCEKRYRTKSNLTEHLKKQHA